MIMRNGLHDSTARNKDARGKVVRKTKKGRGEGMKKLMMLSAVAALFSAAVAAIKLMPGCGQE